MGDDPPFLSVGTEVSAKYKGAFCEAKVRKVVKSIKCKVMFKLGLGSAVVSDDQIKGLLRVGAQVEAKHPEKGQFHEAVINKIQDCSQYTVVFDDGDITTLRRTSLCLKSGRHFAESETLDQLPLTHPEHFGTPVLGGRRGGRRRDDSSDEEEDEDSECGKPERSSRRTEEREPNIGKIVCVEVSEKKKGKETWFPGLIVAPTAQDAVSIRVKDEYLVRSFKDARYYTVPKKEATEFTREIAMKTEYNTLKAAIEKAVQYLDRNELPAHWDREVLFGLDDASSVNESKGSDGESSEEETREEKDHFVAQLYKFMDDNGTPINKGPTINSRDLDLYRLFKIVHKMGGFNRVTNQNGWKAVTMKMVLNAASNSTSLVKQAYKKYLYGFEDFYRKLGVAMNSPRGPKSRARPGRSLIRDRDRAASGCSTPKPEEVEESVVVVVEEVVAVIPVEEEEPPPRKQRERSLPLRLLDTITPKIVKKEEESDDTNEIESNSSQSTVRSQRGTRSRVPKNDEAEPSEGARPSRKRGKSRSEPNDEEPQRVKVKEEASEKKVKTPKSKTRKIEDPVKVEEPKKPDEETASVDPDEPTPKRRGRKPRTLADSEEDEVGKLPAHVDVQIGDKLKVYYGPTEKDSKVTYEAKVCEIRMEGTTRLFMVHYTGWNTRYDEWIKRPRIAENLTWTPNRKRSKSAHGTTLSSTTTPGVKIPKRGKPRGQDSSRSATPSSVTSTSSTGQRNPNAPPGEEKRPPSKNSRRRSRRISEMSAMSSIDSSEDEKPDKKIESEESEPVEESERTPTRRRRRRISENEQSEATAEEPVTPVRRGRRRAVTAPEAASSDPVEDVEITNDSGEELPPVPEKVASPLPEEPAEPKGGDDDIYEFREPEPFEFEVRARRESPFSEERNRFTQRKTVEDDEASPKKASPRAGSAERVKIASPLRPCSLPVVLDVDPVIQSLEFSPPAQIIVEVTPPPPRAQSPPIRPISPPPVKLEMEPVIEAAPVAAILPQILPALSALAARVATSSAVFAYKSAPVEVKEEESEEESLSAEELPTKRERRKVLSREFIESDDDSREDRAVPSPAKEVEEDTTPSEVAEDDDTADDDQEDLSSKSLAIAGSSKIDEDILDDESSLLCQETIPGSPVTHCVAPIAEDPSVQIAVPSTSRSTEMPFASAPSVPNLPRTRGLSGGANANRKRGLRQAIAMQRQNPSLAMENTPPTTPDESLSSSSSSPQGDHGGLSPEHDVKSEREFSENDAGAPSARIIGPRASATAQPLPCVAVKRREEEPGRPQEEESPVKRRRRGDQTRRGRGHGRSPRRTGSDSEETALDYPSNVGCVNLTNYQPRSTRYNFCTDLDPELDATQRIASLQDKLRELRQTYSALKARVVLIDRRKKKLKRKDKESSS